MGELRVELICGNWTACNIIKIIDLVGKEKVYFTFFIWCRGITEDVYRGITWFSEILILSSVFSEFIT